MSEDEDTQAFCPECKKPVPVDAVTCPHCGAKLEERDDG